MFLCAEGQLSVFTDNSILFTISILTFETELFTIKATYKECARDKPYDRRQPAR